MSNASFFEALWPGGLPARLLIWTAPEKHSFWFSSIEEASAQIQSWVSPGRKPGEPSYADIYFGLGLVDDEADISRRKGIPPQYLRMDREDVTWLPGLWVDVDFHEAGSHKKGGLPSRADVDSVLSRSERPPTAIVYSGGGYHLYWLFDEPLRVTQWAETQQLVEGWQRHFRAALGATMDSTHDLSRVMRVPGTPNTKYPGVKCEVITLDGPRYPAEVFLPYRGTEPPRGLRPDGAAAPPGLDPNAEPDWEALDILKTNDPDFDKVWKGKGKSGWSPSEYEMSIASRLVAAGWHDQHITDALIAWRRIHNHAPKLRPDYYQGTLSRAHSNAPAIDVSPETITEELSRRWGVPVTGVRRYGGDNPEYSVVIGETEAKVENVRGIIDQKGLQAAIAIACGVIVPLSKPADWYAIGTAILQSAVAVDLGDEDTVLSRLSSRLDEYLEDYVPLAAEDVKEAASIARQRIPFERDGETYIALPHFLGWLKTRRNETRTAKDMAGDMAACGLSSQQLRVGDWHGRVWSVTHLRVRETIEV